MPVVKEDILQVCKAGIQPISKTIEHALEPVVLPMNTPQQGGKSLKSYTNPSTHVEGGKSLKSYTNKKNYPLEKHPLLLQGIELNTKKFF